MKAIYYNSLTQGKELDVIGKPEGGKVNLGEGETVKVSGCEVVEEPATGKCVLVVDENAPKKKTPTSTKAKTETE